MAEPNKSAWILDRAVDAMGELNAAVDLCLAAEEAALGQPLASRSLDLCVGLGLIEPRKTANKRAPLVVGRGAVRIGGGNPVSLISSTDGEFAITLESLLGTGPYYDAFAFGSLFAVSYVPTAGSRTYAIRSFLLEGATDLPLMIQRTISAEDALKMHVAGSMGTPEPEWAGGDTDLRSVELARFVLDIESYVNGRPDKTSFKVHSRDLRKPRGWGGYADDILSSTVLPAIIASKSALETSQAKVETAMYNVVSEWVDLSCWTPNFEAYWGESENEVFMRPALRAYLADEFDFEF